MEKSVEDFEVINARELSCEKLKEYLREMLASSSQCKALLESVNHDTGEYRIVLQGIIEKNEVEA
ncbi:MAG: hypothetical protein ACE5IR_20670 [bacterium]